MMLLENKLVPQNTIGAMRPDVAPRLGLEQPKAQARLPVRFSQNAGQMVARPSLDESNAGSRQRNGKLVRYAARDLGVLRARLDPSQRHRWSIAIGREKCRHGREGVDEGSLPLHGPRR